MTVQHAGAAQIDGGGVITAGLTGASRLNPYQTDAFILHKGVKHADGIGAAALDADNRVIGTAYNGLYPGFKAQDTFWASREERQKYMLHAEINLCSLFRRGEAKVVACTTMPCTSCMQALCAHGVKTIYYCEPYDKSEAPAIASLYGVELIQVTDYPLSRHFPLVLDS